jgi:hypothetical protein
MKNKRFFAAAMVVLFLVAVPFMAQGAPPSSTSNVTVVNQPSNPVPVTDVNTPGLQRVQILIPLSPYPATISYTVPAGKVLVIEDVNLAVSLAQPNNLPYVRITQPTAVEPPGSLQPTYLGTLIGVGTNGGPAYMVQYRTSVYFPAGAVLTVYWNVYPAGIGNIEYGTIEAGHGAVCGHLINAP